LLPTVSYIGVEIDQTIRFQSRRFRLFKGKRKARLVGIVFSRPELELAKNEIIPSLSYFHFRTQGNICFYFAGYQIDEDSVYDLSNPDSYEEIKGPNNQVWYYEPGAFNDFRNDVEKKTKWKYSGGCDLILTNIKYDESTGAYLDFSSAVVLYLDRLNEIPNMPTVSSCFERIFQYAERQDSKDPAWGFSDWTGVDIAKGAFWEMLFSWVPSFTKKSIRAAMHLAVADIARESN